MLFKLFGLINKIVYKIRFGSNVCFDGIPAFVSHMQIYVRSGNVKIGKGFRMNHGVYMAALNGGKISIGDNVSINRNCILVCHDSISLQITVQSALIPFFMIMTINSEKME